jgi:hypothetical protein
VRLQTEYGLDVFFTVFGGINKTFPLL